MTIASIGLVGKLPCAADFLRIRAGSEAFQGFLGWMIDGVQRAAASGDWVGEGMASSAVQAMCYRGRRGTSALVGALAPSVDRAGRRFPIAAASELAFDAEIVEHPEALPLVLEAVWAVTAQLVVDLQEVSDRSELEAIPLHADVDSSVGDAVRAYRAWTQELELADFLALVFAGDAAHAASAIAVSEEAIAPYRGVEFPDTPLSLRLPLGQAGGAAVCFWLDLIERLAGWRRTIPSFFWSHDGASGALLLHLGRVPPAALRELWLPTGTSDEVCDLVQPERAFRAAGADRWERILEDPVLPVSDVLRAAGVKTPRGV